MNLWPYFASSVYSGDEGSRGFYAVYGAVFEALASEEQLVGGAARRYPSLGGATGAWDDVQAFYSAWEAFSTARTGAT